MNRLANETSPYLRHAATQKIDWQAWSDDPFEQARRENKPVFLSTGAVWCHWCHVMAQESFEDEETAGLLNQHFICIKLDRDERPDIDRRYQQAVAAMGGGSGWPLSVFLTPDKQAFYGGTYFPPEDRQGRPGFKKVLLAAHDFFTTRREDALSYSLRVMDALKQDAFEPSAVSEGLIREAEGLLLAAVDSENGGFGGAPKFPMPGALEFLIRRSRAGADPSLGQAARRMLDAMASGGVHDQVGGGFHRYSVDEAWTIPHFEKMADDNAGLLRNYVDGYAVFGDTRYRDTALDIIAFTRKVLSAAAGGFYASQDADVTPDDEGGYFTWTDEELKKALEPDEYALLSIYLLHDRGSMHHDPARKVLFVKQSVEEFAHGIGVDDDEAHRIIASGKRALLKARGLRATPFIDHTLYTSLNGMLISAYFHAYAVLGDWAVRSFALKSLDRILKERLTDGGLLHTEKVSAVLDDYIHLIDALIAGYEATADTQYLLKAEELMARCIKMFYDAQDGGFYDTASEVLGTRLKTIEDVPHPSANALAILLLLKLWHLTGGDEYRMRAEQSVRLFADRARELGVHAGTYFCSLDASYDMLKLTVEASPESELARHARSITGLVPAAIFYGSDNGRVIPCKRGLCSEPVSDPVRLREICGTL